MQKDENTKWEHKNIINELWQHLVPAMNEFCPNNKPKTKPNQKPQTIKVDEFFFGN